MSKRDDLIRLHKAAVENAVVFESSLRDPACTSTVVLAARQAWRDAENAFMRVAEKVTNE